MRTRGRIMRDRVAVDTLGRLVIPAGMRDRLGIGPQTPLECLVDGEGQVALRVFPGGCRICGDHAYAAGGVTVRGWWVCAACRPARHRGSA